MHFNTMFSSLAFTFPDHVIQLFLKSFSLFIMGRQAAGGVLVQATGGHPAGSGGVQATVGWVLADN